MPKVRLEIEQVTIFRPKKRWNLYFVIMAEHPTEEDKMIISTLPQEPFLLSRRHDNTYQFSTDDDGSDGLFVLSRELPKDRELNVQIYLRHSRKGLRNLGNILKDIEVGIGKDALGIVGDIVGNDTPWLIIAKKAVPSLGNVLAKIPDRSFGFLSAFEKFGPEFENQQEIDRKKDFTGDASLVYTWSLDDD